MEHMCGVKESAYNKVPLSLMIHTHFFCPHVHKGGAVFELTKSCDSKSKQKVILAIEKLQIKWAYIFLKNLC